MTGTSCLTLQHSRNTIQTLLHMISMVVVHYDAFCVIGVIVTGTMSVIGQILVATGMCDWGSYSGCYGSCMTGPVVTSIICVIGQIYCSCYV
jgi:hypothetical protein